MKSQKKLMLTLTLILVFLISSLTIPISAASYVALGTVDDEDNFDIPERNFLTHSSGKAIATWIHSNGKRVEVRVITSTGDIVANYYFNVMSEAYNHKLYTVTVSELDDDEVLIWAIGSYASSPEYIKGMVSKLNINTYVHSEYERNGAGTHVGGVTSAFYGRLSNVLQYDNIFYCLLINADTVNSDYSVLKFDSSTNILTKDGSGTPVQYNFLSNNIQTPTIIKSSSTTFITVVASDAQEYIKTHIYDVSAHTLTYLGVSPINYKMNYNRYLDIIDCGIEDYEYGDDTYYYLYFIYTTSENLGAYTPAFQTYIFRQIFNNTFTEANLIGNSITGLSVSPATYQTAGNIPWTVGINKQSSHTELYVYYPYYEGYWDDILHWSTHKLIITLGNNTVSAFKDIDSTFNTPTDILDTESSLQYGDYDDLVYKEPYSQYQLVIYEIDETLLIYYGVAGLSDYFTMSKSYTPVESPLGTSTIYTFTYTFYNNYVVYQGGIVLIYIDDSLITSKVTNVNGVVTLDVAFNSVGMHNIEVKMYKNMIQTSVTIEDSTNYMVVQSTPPTEDEGITLIGDTLLNAVMNILPVTIVTLMPAYYGGQNGGTIGFIAGLVIGVAIATMSGLLPFYYVYLLALVIAMGLILVLRSGGSNK